MKVFYTTSKISENMHETPEGFLICVGVPIARTGEMIYGENEIPLTGDANGEIKVNREENEVFNSKTMASFEGKPITITHPTEFVTPDNWSRLAKGVMQNVRRGDGDQKNDLLADLLITDSMAINLIRNGLREVSCGYEANYIQEEDGKGRQTRIVGNHLALVDQGRAGSSYAINDHKGKGIKKMTFKEKWNAFLAKFTDEAMQIAQDEAAEKKDDKKDAAKDALKEESPSLASYDDLVKMCDDFGAKMKDMLAPMAKDADKEMSKKDDSKDADVAPAIEDRLKALEASVAKILESQAKAGDADESDKKDEESKDADGEEMESEDADFEANTMTGDAKSRIEILAPGMSSDVKNAKAVALKTAYATADGKKVIDSLTGGKPTFDSAEKVETLFVAASEVLKAQRTSDLSKTKQGSLTRDNESSPFKGAMTPEEVNAINEKFWKKQA